MIINNNPEIEINITVKLSNGLTLCAVIRCIKRYELGNEESIYAYLVVMDNTRTEELRFNWLYIKKKRGISWVEL